MKKKNIIKTGLLSATLLLGTGYAVINSKQVTINGTVSSETRDVNIRIVSSNPNFDMDVSGTTLTFSQNDTSKYETVGTTHSVNFDIFNDETDLNVLLEIESMSSSSEFFEVSDVSTTVVDSEGNPTFDSFGLNQSYLIGPGEYVGCSINITMTDIPITEEESTAIITIKIIATPSR